MKRTGFWKLSILSIFMIAVLVMTGCSGGQEAAGSSNGGSGKTIEAPKETAAAETKAPETAAAETKAAETKAAETKAAETKAPETKAAEKVAPETKAAEKKASETKAADKAAADAAKAKQNAADKTLPGFKGKKKADEVELLHISSAEIRSETSTDIPEVDYYISCYGSYADLTLDKEEAKNYPKLATAIKKLNKEAEDNFGEIFGDLLNDQQDRLQDLKDSGQLKSYEDVMYLHYYTYSPKTVVRADSRVVSIMTRTESFMGGAHGYEARYPVNIDSETGELLTVDDLFTSRGDLETVLREKLLADYQADELSFLDDYMDNIGRGSGWQSEDYNFLIDNNGVLFIFNPYDIAPYASGAQNVYLSFEEDANVFSPKAAKYMETPDKYIQPLEVGSDYMIDTEANGSLNEIRFEIESTYVEKYDYSYDEYYAVINDMSCQLNDIDGYSLNPYLVKKDGKYWFLIQSQSDNDYQILYVYQIRKNHPFLIDLDNYGMAYQYSYDADSSQSEYPPMNDPDDICLDSRMNALGSYMGWKHYSLEDGIPVSKDKWYETNNEFEIGVIAPFEGVEVDLDGNTGAKYRVEEGDKFMVLRVGDNFVDAYINGRDLVRFDYDNSEYPNKLDGQDEGTLFEFLPYAG